MYISRQRRYGIVRSAVCWEWRERRENTRWMPSSTSVYLSYRWAANSYAIQNTHRSPSNPSNPTHTFTQFVWFPALPRDLLAINWLGEMWWPIALTDIYQFIVEHMTADTHSSSSSLKPIYRYEAIERRWILHFIYGVIPLNRQIDKNWVFRSKHRRKEKILLTPKKSNWNSNEMNNNQLTLVPLATTFHGSLRSVRRSFAI